jgi:5-formyltetrahydrofolate cyclo-ligase
MSGAAAPGAAAARKRELRAQARAAAARLPSETRALRSRRVEALLVELPVLAAAHGVALYSPLRDEVQLPELRRRLEQRGCRLAYPRIEGAALALHWVGQADALRAGSRGVLEPGAGSAVALGDALEAILVPGLLFDRRGRRLGRGGGHYDRLLAFLPGSVAKIGVCLAEQLVDELPAEPHDVPLSWVVTDREVLGIS